MSTPKPKQAIDMQTDISDGARRRRLEVGGGGRRWKEVEGGGRREF